MAYSPEVLVETMIHDLSRNEWEQVKPESWQDIERVADHMATLAFEISIYAFWRGASGNGDYGHEKAFAEARKAHDKIRKLLGYNA